MTQTSIILLNRLSTDPMNESCATLPQIENAEVIYVTPAPVSSVVATPITPTIRRVEYPSTMLDAESEADRIIGTQYATGACLLYSDTQSLFKPWEISNIAGMLTGSLCLALRMHRPNGREVDNTADLAALSLNAMLRHPHLAAASLLRFPHGILRDAFNVVDMDELRIPPKFLTKCILAGMRADTFYRVDEPQDRVLDDGLLIKSHMEAIHELLQHQGTRGGFTDFYRRREEWKTALKAVPEQ